MEFRKKLENLGFSSLLVVAISLPLISTLSAKAEDSSVNTRAPRYTSEEQRTEANVFVVDNDAGTTKVKRLDSMKKVEESRVVETPVVITNQERREASSGSEERSSKTGVAQVTQSKNGDEPARTKPTVNRKADSGAMQSKPNGEASTPKPRSVEQRPGQEILDKKMIRASNQIDGVDIDLQKFDAEKDGFDWGKLNPFHWVFKPVTDMQKRVVHLQKQLMRLEGPIANLQKPMIGLREDMTEVHSDLGNVKSKMGKLDESMSGVNSQMGSVDRRLSHVESQLDKMYEPIVALRAPVEELQSPVSNVSSELTTLKTDLKDLKEVVSLTSTLILVAIVAVGLLISVGTPIAALFAYRHRRAIIKAFGKGEAQAEDDPLKEGEDAELDKAKDRELAHSGRE